MRLIRSPPTASRVLIDPDVFMQALINLLSNAAEAALGTAEPVVRLETTTDRDGRVAVVVSDNGPGIGALDPEALFRAFFTTKPEGTGVGLSLARQIVRAHGGDIVHEAAPAGGAAFRIEL